MHVSSDSFSTLSNKPSGAFGVDTITMYGSDFAMYLSLTCLTSSCSPFLKKSPSSIKMNLGLSKALYGILEVKYDNGLKLSGLYFLPFSIASAVVHLKAMILL